jgi:tetratricopeptide (TPR) repeat protein
MNELKAIALKIYSVETTKSPQDMVDNFERHQALIEATDYNSSPETYTLYTRLTSDYAIALTDIESHKKAIPLLNKALSLLSNDTTIDKDNIKEINFYQAIIFRRGISNYYLKNYSESKKDFLLLTELYPDNIKFKTWLIAINKIFLNKIKNILWLLVAGFLLIEVFLKHYDLPHELFLWAGVFSLLVAVVLEIVISDRKKRQLNADT